MAGDSDLPKSADKGKGKAVDAVKKPEEVKKDKDGKAIPFGKKDDDNAECLSCFPTNSSGAYKSQLTWFSD